MTSAHERRVTAWVLAACAVGALVLRAPYALAPLGRDEGGIAFIARNWSAGHGSLYGSYWLDRPPLLVALFRMAVLDGAGGVRLLGAVAAVALVLAIAGLAQAVAGLRAGRLAGVLAAGLTGSVAIGAVFTPAELLAAVPSTLSLWCLVTAHRSRLTRWVMAAGVLAVLSALIKQSFLDPGLAGLAFVAASCHGSSQVRLRWPLAYAAAAAVPLGALVAWQVLGHLPPGGFLYALIGFRVDALRALAGTGADTPIYARLGGLALPALGSGLALAAAVAVLGLRQLRGARVLGVTITVWLLAGVFGVLGGGSYWPHYLIQLVPVTCVLAAMGLSAARPRLGVGLAAACVAIPVLVGIGASAYAAARPPAHPELVVADYVRDHARPGDTQYVMYARADVVFYAGLPSPYPYAWTLMIRAVPGARRQLVDLLTSPRRPTWVVGWQDDDRWHLDLDGAMDRVLQREYRLTAVVCGHRIYLRDDRPIPGPVTTRTCA